MIEIVVENVYGSRPGEGKGRHAICGNEVLRCKLATHEVDHRDACGAEEARDNDKCCHAHSVACAVPGESAEVREGGAADNGAVGVSHEEDVVGLELGEDCSADGVDIVLHVGGAVVDEGGAVAGEIDAQDCVAGSFEFFSHGVEVCWDVLRSCQRLAILLNNICVPMSPAQRLWSVSPYRAESLHRVAVLEACRRARTSSSTLFIMHSPRERWPSIY